MSLNEHIHIVLILSKETTIIETLTVNTFIQPMLWCVTYDFAVHVSTYMKKSNSINADIFSSMNTYLQIDWFSDYETI